MHATSLAFALLGMSNTYCNKIIAKYSNLRSGIRIVSKEGDHLVQRGSRQYDLEIGRLSYGSLRVSPLHFVPSKRQRKRSARLRRAASGNINADAFIESFAKKMLTVYYQVAGKIPR